MKDFLKKIVSLLLRFFDRIGSNFHKHNHYGKQMHIKTSSRVVINGKSFMGNDIQINNGKVYVDNFQLSGVLSSPIKVEVHGNVEYLETGSGDVDARSIGKIKTGSGDVTCGDVIGNITTGSGDVECGRVSGNISTGSGDVSIR